jgi:molybdopterin synthase sulfur carrier subunit
MFIRVLYFGSLRETLGRADDVGTLPEGIRVIDAWHWFNPEKSLPENTLCAINQEYVKADATLCAGDELAFFPPVTGG